MRNSKLIVLGLWLWVGLAAVAGAMSFEYADGTKIEGEIVHGKPESLQIRTEGNKYEDLPWSKLSQATLKQLAADPKHKLAQFVEPYIEIPLEDIIKKTEVVVKPVPRLERPPKGSLIGAMFGSSVGLVVLLLVYGANIYAAYEVAVIRAQPPGMVCGLAAVAPIIAPVVFLCLPTKMKISAAEAEEAAADAAAARSASHADSSPLAPDPGSGAAAGHGAYSIAHTEAAAPAALPQTQVFKRGQFTFNRRFLETKFAAFFGMIRRDAEKDLVLVVKCARGEFIVTRISRIASNDMHVDVHRGGASQEVQIPFLEIQEIQIKHKDA